MGLRPRWMFDTFTHMTTIAITHTSHGKGCGGCQRAVTAAVARLRLSDGTRVSGTSAVVGSHAATVARPGR
jgi:hypothetical protein